MSRFKSYPVYKDSGIEWLGESPFHWDVGPVKVQFTVQLGKMLQNEPEGDKDVQAPYFKAAHVQWHSVMTHDLPTMWASPDDLRTYGVKAGDLLVCEGGEGGRSGVVTSAPAGAIIQNALHRVRPKDESSVRYLEYVMRSVSAGGWFDVLNNRATIAHFTREKLAALRIPLPSVPEQRAIAAFLDRETARIDELVAKKERLIELLQEKRTALITRAVTRGFESKPILRTSDSLVFPRIPESWEMVKLRRLLRRVLRPVEVDPECEYREIGIRSWGKGVFHKDPVRGALLEEKSIYRIEPGDFVLNIVFAWEGAVAVAGDSELGMVASHRFPTFRPSADIDLDYLLMVLQTEHGRALMEVNSPGAAGRNKTIRLDQFLEELIPLPPLGRQKEIVRLFRGEEGRMAGLVAKVQDAIARLKELRTALISAAVTGKIDVRDAAPTLPEQVS